MAAPTKLQRAMTRLVQRHPFYATVALNMAIKPVADGVIHEMSNGASDWAATDGTSIFLNQSWFDGLPLDEAVGVIQHEVEHVARLHPWRQAARDASVWNYATDAVINHSMTTHGASLPAGCVDGTPWAGQTEEQIYSQLPKPPKKGGGQGGGQGQGGKGQQPYQPNPNGGHSHDTVIQAKDQSQAAQSKAKQVIAKAVQVAKARGNMPAHLQGEIDDLLNPTVDWREPLQRFLTEISNTDYSWARINRRYVADGVYLPGLAGEGTMRKLGVIIDTSGSIGIEELRYYFSELCGAIEEACPSQLVVAYCDAKVQHHDVFDDPSAAEVAETRARHGGGGTSMPAGLRWFERNHEDVVAVIVLTDMYTDFDDEPAFPVLWATETDNITAPYGETLRISRDDQ